MATEAPLLFVPVGTNDARPFGMDARDRACRLATSAGFKCADEVAPAYAALLANMAFAWDPAWLGALRDRPRSILMFEGKPVLAHVPAGADAARIIEEFQSGRPLGGYDVLDAETSNDGLGKRVRRLFVLPLDAANPEPVERAAYDAACEGAADLLTVYVWRSAAFYLARWAARVRLSPNLVMLVGAALCLLAFILFWVAQYWWGVAAGFVFMLLDTVAGKLARVTGTSSRWGEAFGHGIDLVHPPFWYWAWEHGLAAFGRPLEPITATMVLLAIISGYVAQHVLEGLFTKRFDGLHIHAWRRVDSQFRLVTARRNPNMIILTCSLLLFRPDVGLELVAWWTLASLIFHAVRLAQASEQSLRGMPIASWLDA